MSHTKHRVLILALKYGRDNSFRRTVDGRRVGAIVQEPATGGELASTGQTSTPSLLASTTPTTTTTTSVERRRKALTESLVHETVRDRVTAGGKKSQQMDEVHRQCGNTTDGARVVEDDPRLKDVHRRPADEELYDDDEQHLEDPTLGHHASVGAGLSQGQLELIPDLRRPTVRLLSV